MKPEYYSTRIFKFRIRDYHCSIDLFAIEKFIKLPTATYRDWKVIDSYRSLYTLYKDFDLMINTKVIQLESYIYMLDLDIQYLNSQYRLIQNKEKLRGISNNDV